MLSSLHISVASPSLMSCFLSCISSASIHVSFVAFDSSLRFADVLCPWVFIFITSLHHISSPFFVRFLSILWLLLQIRQYSQGVAAASGALISLINSLLRSVPLRVFVRPLCHFLYFYLYMHQQSHIKTLPQALLGNHCSLSMLIHELNFYTPGQHLLFIVFFLTCRQFPLWLGQAALGLCVWACRL